MMFVETVHKLHNHACTDAYGVTAALLQRYNECGLNDLVDTVLVVALLDCKCNCYITPERQQRRVKCFFIGLFTIPA